MHELALMTLLLWGVGYAACRLADRLRISRLALGVAAGLLLGPAVLGQAAPGVYEKYFGGGGEVRQKMERVQADRAITRQALAATGVTPIAVEQFDEETVRLLEPLKEERIGRIADRDQFKWLLLHISGLMVLAGLAGEYPFRLRELRGREAKRFALVMFVFLALGWVIRTCLFNAFFERWEAHLAGARVLLFYHVFMTLGCIGTFVVIAVGILSGQKTSFPDDRRYASRLIKALVLLFALAIFLPIEIPEAVDSGMRGSKGVSAVSSPLISEGVPTKEAAPPTNPAEIDSLARLKSLFILTVKVPAGTPFLVAAALLLIWYALKVEKVDTEATSHDPLAFPYPVMPLLALGLLMLGGASPFLIVALACLFLDAVKGMKTIGTAAHQVAAPLLLALSGLKAVESIHTGYGDWVNSGWVVVWVAMGMGSGMHLTGMAKILRARHFLSITRLTTLNYAMALLAVGVATDSIYADMKVKWAFGSAVLAIAFYALIGGIVDRFNDDKPVARKRKA